MRTSIFFVMCLCNRNARWINALFRSYICSMRKWLILQQLRNCAKKSDTMTEGETSQFFIYTYKRAYILFWSYSLQHLVFMLSLSLSLSLEREREKEICIVMQGQARKEQDNIYNVLQVLELICKDRVHGNSVVINGYFVSNLSF